MATPASALARLRRGGRRAAHDNCARRGQDRGARLGLGRADRAVASAQRKVGSVLTAASRIHSARCAEHRRVRRVPSAHPTQRRLGALSNLAGPCFRSSLGVTNATAAAISASRPASTSRTTNVVPLDRWSAENQSLGRAQACKGPLRSYQDRRIPHTKWTDLRGPHSSVSREDGPAHSSNRSLSRVAFSRTTARSSPAQDCTRRAKARHSVRSPSDRGTAWPSGATGGRARRRAEASRSRERLP